MVNKSEIFGGKEAEIKLKFEADKDNYDWETVKTQLEKISQTEKIDAKLEELGGNVDSYYTYLKGLIDKEKVNPLDKATKAVKTQADKQKEKILAEVDEAIEKKGGMLGSIIGWLGGGSVLLGWIEEEKNIDPKAGWTDKLGAKFFGWIATTALGWLGIKGLDKFGRSDEGEKTGEIPDELNKKAATISGSKDILKGTESLKSVYSKSGYNIIKFFTPVEFKNGVDAQNIFQSVFVDKSYEELRVLYKKSSDSQKVSIEGFEGDEGSVYNVLHSLFHDYSYIIYETKLTKSSIQSILDIDNIDNIFTSDEIDKIKLSYDYKKLDFSIISRLVALSFKGLLSSAAILAKNKIKGAYDYLIEDSSLLKGINQEVKSRKENLISDNSFSIIKGDTGIGFGGKNRANISIDKLLEGKEIGKDYTPEDKNQLIKFLHFRDKILSIPSNNKYSLGLGDTFKDSFNTGAHLGKIYLLYLILDGKDIDNIDSFERGNLYFWILEVLRKKDGKNDISGEYESKLLKEATDENSSIFNENEKKVLRVLAYRVLKVSKDKLFSKLGRGKDFIDVWFKDMLPDSFGNETKDDIINGVETAALGLLGAYLIFGKKNFALKLIIATSGILGYLALALTGEGALTKIKDAMSEDDYNRLTQILGEDPMEYLKNDIDNMLRENSPTITLLDDKNKKKDVQINSMDVANDLRKGDKKVEEIINEQIEGDHLYFDENGDLQNISWDEVIDKSKKSPVFVKDQLGFNVYYKGKPYKFDVGPNAFFNTIDNIGNDGSDEFNGRDISYNNLELDINKKRITFLGGYNVISMKHINDLFSKHKIKKDYMRREYVIVKKGSSGGILNKDLILIEQ